MICSVLDRKACLKWEEKEESIWDRRELPPEEDVAARLLCSLLDQPSWLEARYLYDTRGSDLFERICDLPEYYLTRTENRLLEEHSDAIVHRSGLQCLVEIGAGFSVKTRHLLSSLVNGHGEVRFVPIDVSLSALQGSRDALRREFPQIEFAGLHAPLEVALPDLEPDLPKMILFLGSSLGNFMRAELLRFLSELSRAMGPRDTLLLGVDRIKDEEMIRSAYDDSAGLTREFILNSLDSVNQVTGTNFERACFRYTPRFNRKWSQMEMILSCRENHLVDFPTLDRQVRWKKGDELLVEVSRKFDPHRLAEQMSAFGLELLEHYTDSRDWFSLLLFRRAAGGQ